MPSVVTSLIIVAVTLLLAIAVFALFSSYFSIQGISLSQTQILVSQAKQTQLTVSPISYQGIGPDFSYFNVSFLVWYSTPVKNVSIVTFVANPLPGLGPYLYTPLGGQNSTVLENVSGKYVQLTSFKLDGVVSVPQGQQLNVNAQVYSSKPEGTFLINAKVKPGQIVVVWLLTYEFGKWYRVYYTYVNPSNGGLGLYVVTHTPPFDLNSTTTSYKPPHLFSSNQGVQIGLWFEPLMNSTQNSSIVYFTFNSTSNKYYYICVYQSGLTLYLKSNLGGSTNIESLGTVSQFNFYFINISYGKQVNNEVTLYNSMKDEIKQIPLESQGTTNSYIGSITFGSKSSTDEITQAFLVTQKDNGQKSQKDSGAAFYNVSSTVLQHNAFYNNTVSLYNIIKNDDNKTLNGIVYWFFVYPSSSPPLQTYALFWYYPNGAKTLSTLYIPPESGSNTWIIG
ncbi:MAG: hypothetical protein QXH43_08145 [Metallosphaera sp.]|uniref:hypothetical protein n=1 Tax=Metallosphaera sp. TaxID=2020860 RepID=UPI00316BDA2D